MSTETGSAKPVVTEEMVARVMALPPEQRTVLNVGDARVLLRVALTEPPPEPEIPHEITTAGLVAWFRTGKHEYTDNEHAWMARSYRAMRALEPGPAASGPKNDEEASKIYGPDPAQSFRCAVTDAVRTKPCAMDACCAKAQPVYFRDVGPGMDKMKYIGDQREGPRRVTEHVPAVNGRRRSSPFYDRRKGPQSHG